MESHSLKMYFEEEGTGGYTRHNKHAIHAQNFILKLAADHLKVPIKQLENPEQMFTVADYGTADGQGFIKILPRLIDIIRNHYGKDRQVTVVFEDGPENDFMSVFRSCSGQSSEVQPALFDNNGVFVMSCGRSFYEQCLPNNSLTLGFSTTAINWLSKVPCLIDECFKQFTSKENSLLFQQQAEKDWETFLLQRAKELQSGGCLFLLLSGADDSGHYFGNTRHNTRNIMEFISQHWMGFHSRGLITRDELQKSTYPLYNERSQDDLKKPFLDKNSAVVRAGLNLLDVQTVISPSAEYEDFLQTGNGEVLPSDALKYAERLMNYIRSWNYHILYQALDKSRSHEQKQALLHQYYTEMRDIVCKQPHSFICEIPYHYTLITKN